MNPNLSIFALHLNQIYIKKIPSPTQPEKAFKITLSFCRLGRIRSKRLKFVNKELIFKELTAELVDGCNLF